jgi:hypothetical protein
MCEKIEYDSYYQALKELKRINYMIDFFHKEQNLKLKRIYKCEKCGKFHLTSIGGNKKRYCIKQKYIEKEITL